MGNQITYADLAVYDLITHIQLRLPGMFLGVFTSIPECLLRFLGQWNHTGTRPFHITLLFLLSCCLRCTSCAVKVPVTEGAY